MFKIISQTVLLFLFSLNVVSQIQIGNDINGNSGGDQLGWSTSISADGKIIAVSASGSATNKGYVKVLENNNGIWQQLGDDIEGENISDYFGYSVSLSKDGTILAIGAKGFDNNRGYVQVYTYENSTWSQLGNNIEGKIELSTTSDDELEFGYSVSLNSTGDVLAVGAVKSDTPGTGSSQDIPNTGAVVVLKLENNTWVKKGGVIYGEAEEDKSGNSVSIAAEGNVVAVGAFNNDGGGNTSGHTKTYIFSDENWLPLSDDIDGEAPYDQSGFSVSLHSSGNYLAVGAPSNDGSFLDAGQVKMFYNDVLNPSQKWEAIGEAIYGEASVDQSGHSVSLASNNGLYLAIGSIDNDTNGDKSGHVRIFSESNGVFTQIGVINGESSGDQSGFSVSLSEDATTVVIGAPFNEGFARNAGHVRVFDLSLILSTENNKLSDVTIYPNPTSNIITIQIENSILEKVNIYNSLGQLVKTETSKIITTVGLKSGIYNLEVITDKGKSSKKIVVN